MEGWSISILLTAYTYIFTQSDAARMSSCVMIAASVPRGHGHTSDATAGAGQRPAAAAATGGHRLDRPLRRQPHAISIAGRLQPAHGAIATLEQSQQLKETRERLLAVSSLMFTNLTSHFIPITPANYSPPLYMCNKRFKLCAATTHAPLCPLSFRTMCRNLGSNGNIRSAEL